MITGPMLVVQTWTRRDGGYLIELARDDHPRSVRLVLRTHDDALYQTALAIEGFPTLITATWHQDERVPILDSLDRYVVPPERSFANVPHE